MPIKMMKNMKGIDLSCASPASTAICSTTHHRSMVRDASKPLRRLNSYAGNHHNIHRQTLSSSVNPPDLALRRKSSADASDLSYFKFNPIFNNHITHNKGSSNNSNNKSPPSYSSRYLLGDSPFLDSLSDQSDITTNLSDKQVIKPKNHKGSANYDDYSGSQRHKSMGFNSSRNDSSVVKSLCSAPSRDQVVVLRVSLHCKCRGCEAKLKKHLSKMEGVTSFSIDMEAKKVTVIGNVTPSAVLTSISKIKNAQFWPSPPSSSSSAVDFSY